MTTPCWSGGQAPQDIGDAPVLARALLQHQLEAELRVAVLLKLQTALGLAVLDGASLESEQMVGSEALSYLSGTRGDQWLVWLGDQLSRETLGSLVLMYWFPPED